MKRLLFCSVLLLLALCACAPAAGETGELSGLLSSPMRPARRSGRGAPPWRARGAASRRARIRLEGLVECLLSGPLSGALRSPIPEGVRQLSAPAIEDGVCRVDLSEGYGSLSGVELTLADYCIALTLCQVPGVEAVSIDVEGEPIPYRARQVLRPEDAAPHRRRGRAGPPGRLPLLSQRRRLRPGPPSSGRWRSLQNGGAGRRPPRRLPGGPPGGGAAACPWRRGPPCCRCGPRERCVM